jgi:hypothetical protein
MSGPTPPLGDAAGWRAFTASVTALVGDRDPLDVQTELADSLATAVAGVSLERLRTPEAPGKWSVAAVLEHLADMEAVFGYRLRQVLTADAPRLESVDQDAWAMRGTYIEGDPTTALALLTLLRARNLRVWRGLSASEWERVGVHGDRGPETLRELARIIAGHDLAHRRQVARILDQPFDVSVSPGCTVGDRMAQSTVPNGN